ncbi:MAG: SixA phosphatase family protein [Rhodospirillaceae bacterium]
MKRLLLLRHAKSDWQDDSLADHDRPLSARGQRASLSMSHFLASRWQPEAGESAAPRSEDKLDATSALPWPDLVLCSTALRAEETLAPLLEHLKPKKIRVEREQGIYTFDYPPLLARIKALPEAVTTVLMIGHNPAFERLADRLAGPGTDSKSHGVMRRKYPTCALAELCLEGPWADLEPGGARLVAFTRPKDLM